jgi:hypothetical protein
MEFVLTRSQIRIVQGTQNSHLPQLWNKNQAQPISIPIRKHPLARQKMRWEINIKMNQREIVYYGYGRWMEQGPRNIWGGGEPGNIRFESSGSAITVLARMSTEFFLIKYCSLGKRSSNVFRVF